MANAAVSVLTIAHNRDQHLLNLLAGLSMQTVKPDEVILVFMNQPNHPQLPNDVAITALDIESKMALPLAAARNAAAAAASGDTLVFLDVDCIPAPDFVEKICDDAGLTNLTMGTPKYLRPSWDQKLGTLETSSEVHPARADLQPGPQSNYDRFWSLCFALSAATFQKVGGFDEDFVGYGAEDTDFAWRCKQSGIPFTTSGATAYHQHHPSYRPPLNHLEDIVLNALTFRHKWGLWPMEGWLSSFAAMNLVDWEPKGTRLELLRNPTRDELERARSTDLFA